MLLDFNIGKPKFKYYTENGIFYAENNSRKNFFALLFFGFMSFFIFSGLILLINEKKICLELIIIGFINTIVGIFGLRKFLWLIRGKEIIIIDNENLKISKSGTFWTIDKIFKKSDIKNLRDKFQDDDYNKTPFESLNEYRNSIKEYNRGMIYLTIGEVLFDYKFSKVRVFNWLNQNERKTLIVEMRKHIENKIE